MFFRRIVIRRRLIHPDKSKINFKEGQTLSLMGSPFTILVDQDGNSKYSIARVRDGVVKIRLAESLNGKQRERHVAKLSRRAITRAILPLVESRVRQFNEQYFNSELGRVKLKDNVSNWGSCSRRNNINLDFRLLFGPAEVLDAVIAHELAHTKHRDHSRDYYNTLLAVMPDNRERLRWLRDNGQRLTSEASGTIQYPEAMAERKEGPPIEGTEAM